MLKEHIFIVFFLALVVIFHLSFFVRFSDKNLLKKTLSLLLFLSLVVSRLYSIINFSSSLVYDDIDTMTGQLISDTNLSSNGSTIYSLKLESIEKSGNIKIKSPGIVSITIKNQKTRGIAGEIYRFLGVKKIDETFFSADSAILLKSNIFQNIRRKFLVFAEKRILSLNNGFREETDYFAHILAMKLFLGRNSGEEDQISNAIKKTGLEYVFALSGMHLGVFALIIKKLFSRLTSKKKSKILEVIAVSIYFFLISRNPSFVRAYIMYISSMFFSPYISIIISFLAQTLLQPASSLSLGFEYSYLAISGIYIFYKLIFASLSYFFGRNLSKYFAISLSAIMFSSITSYINFSYFKVIGILVAPIVSAIAASLLMCGFLFVLFEASSFISFIARILYILLRFVLEKLSLISFDCGLIGIFALWGFVALIIAFYIYNNNKNRKYYNDIKIFPLKLNRL